MVREEQSEESGPVCSDFVGSFCSWNRDLHHFVEYSADVIFYISESCVMLAISGEHILLMKKKCFRPLCIIRARIFEVN